VIAKLLQACVFFQPAEIACWEVLLRDSGAARELPEPAVRRAMSRTLKFVWHLAGGMPAEPAATRRESSEFAGGRCGREALSAFLASGGRAIELVFAEIERAHPECPETARRQMRRRIARAFVAVARVEFDALCRDCPGISECAWRDPGQRARGGPDARPHPTDAGASRSSASAQPKREQRIK
jgi:hypothetical protein